MTEQDVKALQEIHQDHLNFLHELACKYGISMNEMQKLCYMTAINFHELQHHVITPTQH